MGILMTRWWQGVEAHNHITFAYAVMQVSLITTLPLQKTYYPSSTSRRDSSLVFRTTGGLKTEFSAKSNSSRWFMSCSTPISMRHGAAKPLNDGTSKLHYTLSHLSLTFPGIWGGYHTPWRASNSRQRVEPEPPPSPKLVDFASLENSLPSTLWPCWPGLIARSVVACLTYYVRLCFVLSIQCFSLFHIVWIRNNWQYTGSSKLVVVTIYFW